MVIILFAEVLKFIVNNYNFNLHHVTVAQFSF